MTVEELLRLLGVEAGQLVELDVKFHVEAVEDLDAQIAAGDQVVRRRATGRSTLVVSATFDSSLLRATK